MKVEEFAIHKFPRKGKCEKSCFANGIHRVGIVPLYSVLDGGAAGDSAREVCLECGKVFKEPRWFILKDQPRRFGKGKGNESLKFICWNWR